MRDRITIKNLRGLCDVLNRATGNPTQAYVADETGRFRAQVGCFIISQCYGGYQLAQISSEGGAELAPIGIGHKPARALWDEMHALLRGIEAGRKLGEVSQ